MWATCGIVVPCAQSGSQKSVRGKNEGHSSLESPMLSDPNGMHAVGTTDDDATASGLTAPLSRKQAAVDLAIVLCGGVALYAVPWWRYVSSNLALGPTANFIAFTVFNLVFVFALTAWMLHRRKLPPSTIGLNTPRLPGDLRLAGVGVLVMAIAPIVEFLYAYEYWRWLKDGSVDAPAAAATAETLSAADWATSGFIMLVAAITEELLFRGLLLRYMALVTKRPTVAVVLSALVFGGLHAQWSAGNALTAIWMGIVLGTLYVKHNSLVAVVLAHFIFNAILLLLYQLGA